MALLVAVSVGGLQTGKEMKHEVKNKGKKKKKKENFQRNNGPETVVSVAVR